MHPIVFPRYLPAELQTRLAHLSFIKGGLNSNSRVNKSTCQPCNIEVEEDDDKQVEEGLGYLGFGEMDEHDDSYGIDDEEGYEEEEV